MTDSLQEKMILKRMKNTTVMYFQNIDIPLDVFLIMRNNRRVILNHTVSTMWSILES